MEKSEIVGSSPSLGLPRPFRKKWVIPLLSFVFILCASISNSVMDSLVSRYDQSVFRSLPQQSQSWFDPRISYKNKWLNGDRAQGEAFPLSSTTLVPLTDAWHFFKFLTILFLYCAILVPFTQLYRLRWYHWILVYLLADLVRGFFFELFYTQILIK